ncbi:hypothetical protein [Roseobacter cerasinus]|nr:hypothetical protein [Roseobacter cerasinus]
MTHQTAKSPVLPRANCIGCTDCKGLCRAIVEMALLPETVLRHPTASP